MPAFCFLSLFTVFLSLSNAEAKQKSHSVEKNPTEWEFQIKWHDANNKVHSAQFSLNTGMIKSDIQEPLNFPMKKSAQFQAQSINRWSRDLKGVKIKASTKGAKVSIRASGKGLFKVRRKLKEAKSVGEKATEKFVEDNGYTFLNGKVIPDHLGHVVEYSDDLSPLVEALGGPTKDPRVFANRALSFAQTIPYEKRGRKPDKYRRPLSLVGRNKGDCDSKTVLFLAIMNDAYPNMPLGVVYIPGHAFGAIGIEPERGDVHFRANGQHWVGVEPVGPAVVPVGKLGRKSRRRIRFRSFKIKSI
jgi:hypothetical protein